MSEKFTDKKLEEMLRNYFRRQPRFAFSIDLDRKKRSDYFMSKGMLLKTTAVCACAAAIVTVGVFSSANINKDQDSVLSSNYENQLFVTAHADEQKDKANIRMVTMGENDTFFISDDDQYNDVFNYLKDGETAYLLDDGKGTRLSGEELEDYLSSGESQWNGFNVVQFKLESNEEITDLEGDSEYGGVYYNSQGVYYFLDNEEKTPLLGEDLDEYLSSGETKWNGYDVIKIQDADFLYSCVNMDIDGENIVSCDVSCENGMLLCSSCNDFSYDWGNTVNVSFDSDRYIQWSAKGYPDKDFEANGTTSYDYDSVLKRSKEAKENLQTADDYTNYFGDTITVTAHFEDGSSQTSVIDVTLDVNGNYIVNYR